MGIVRKAETEIDGIKYSTRTLPATVGLQIMPRLVALLGDKLMALVFKVGGEGIQALSVDPRIGAGIITNISDRIAARQGEGHDPTSVFRDLMLKTKADKIRLGDTEVQGSVYEHFDEHFAGDYQHLLAVVGWVGGVNFMPPSAESP